jgi:hypothetical protein
MPNLAQLQSLPVEAITQNGIKVVIDILTGPGMNTYLMDREVNSREEEI